MIESKDFTNYFYVGGYASSPNPSLHTCMVCIETGEMSIKHSLIGVDKPSYLALNQNRDKLYSNGGKGVVSYKVDDNHKVTFLNEQVTKEGVYCHVSIDKSNKYLIASNYGIGHVAIYPIEEDGSLKPFSDLHQHTGKSINQTRQTSPHVHFSAQIDSDHFAVVDLGTDKVFFYKLDAIGGKFEVAETPYFEIKAGSGPRHLVIHPNGKFVFILNEILSTVWACRVGDKSEFNLELIQEINMLPDHCTTDNTAAAIKLSPDGKFLYASNRGFDSIACYKVDDQTGGLNLIEIKEVNLKCPRDFSIHPSGKILIAGGQESHKISSYFIDQMTGKLSETGFSLDIELPSCILFHDV